MINVHIKRLSSHRACVVVLLFLAAVTSTEALSTTKEDDYDYYVDPIFSMDFDMKSVLFPTISQGDLPSGCNTYFSGLKKKAGKFKLLAQYFYDNTKIYITEYVNDSVSIFVIRNNLCQFGRADGSLGQFAKPILNDDEVVALYRDALMKYERAFGGKRQFLEWLESSPELRVGGCMAKNEGRDCDYIFRRTQPYVIDLVNEYRRSKE